MGINLQKTTGMASAERLPSSVSPGGSRKAATWEIDYDELELERELGRGAYGTFLLTAVMVCLLLIVFLSLI